MCKMCLHSAKEKKENAETNQYPLPPHEICTFWSNGPSNGTAFPTFCIKRFLLEWWLCVAAWPAPTTFTDIYGIDVKNEGSIGAGETVKWWASEKTGWTDHNVQSLVFLVEGSRLPIDCVNLGQMICLVDDPNHTLHGGGMWSFCHW